MERWHTIVASRNKRSGSLVVDGAAPVTGEAPPGLSELNIDKSVYLGGLMEKPTKT